MNSAQNLSDMLSFTLETDEGPVTVRARASGSLAYLKRMIAVQLYLSPRLELRLATLKGAHGNACTGLLYYVVYSLSLMRRVAGAGDALRDDMIIQPYADDNVTNEADRLQLSVTPRPLSELAPGAPGLPPLQQIRVRTIIPGSSQACHELAGLRVVCGIRRVLASSHLNHPTYPFRRSRCLSSQCGLTLQLLKSSLFS